jgi:hypothetical protein
MSPGEDAGEEDSVVVAVRLVTEHGDVEGGTTPAGEDVVDEARPRHPVPDHDQPLLRRHDFRHGFPPVLDGASMRTAHTLNSGIRLVGSRAGLVNQLADPLRPVGARTPCLGGWRP